MKKLTVLSLGFIITAVLITSAEAIVIDPLMDEGINHGLEDGLEIGDGGNDIFDTGFRLSIVPPTPGFSSWWTFYEPIAGSGNEFTSSGLCVCPLF